MVLLRGEHLGCCNHPGRERERDSHHERSVRPDLPRNPPPHRNPEPGAVGASDEVVQLARELARNVTAGTVEEKIIELQLKKGALADSILNNAEDAATALSQEDLTWLLET